MEPNKPSRKKLLFRPWVACAVLLLLLSCCCLGGVGGGVALYFGVGPGAYYLSGREELPGHEGELRLALQSGMTLAEIEAKLGPGKPTSMAEVKAVYRACPGGKTSWVDVTGIHEHARFDRGANYRWRNGDDFIIVLFDKPAKEGGKAGANHLAQTAAKPLVQQQKGSFPTYK